MAAAVAVDVGPTMLHHDLDSLVVIVEEPVVVASAVSVAVEVGPTMLHFPVDSPVVAVLVQERTAAAADFAAEPVVVVVQKHHHLQPLVTHPSAESSFPMLDESTVPRGNLLPRLLLQRLLAESRAQRHIVLGFHSRARHRILGYHLHTPLERLLFHLAVVLLRWNNQNRHLAATAEGAQQQHRIVGFHLKDCIVGLHLHTLRQYLLVRAYLHETLQQHLGPPLHSVVGSPWNTQCHHHH
mmetsp:Transcript_27609/g.45280  ORF Transcript_27609/g.45280 Transcript_27609/m.45280 type:complete len:240 (-) Transcript_27609:793-1512(-)